jgi:hypothetical protein
LLHQKLLPQSLRQCHCFLNHCTNQWCCRNRCTDATITAIAAPTNTAAAIIVPTNDIAVITAPTLLPQSLRRCCHHNYCTNAAIAAHQCCHCRNPCAHSVAAAITAVANQPSLRRRRHRNNCANTIAAAIPAPTLSTSP